jgi:hypothetical protein
VPLKRESFALHGVPISYPVVGSLGRQSRYRLACLQETLSDLCYKPHDCLAGSP